MLQFYFRAVARRRRSHSDTTRKREPHGPAAEGSAVWGANEMNFLWLAHAIPYPPKAGFLLRSHHLLRGLARRNRVDLIAFVQEPWVRTVFASLEEGIEESRRALGQLCHNIAFLPIDSVKGRWGKQATALRALLCGASYTTSWLVSAAARSRIASQLSSEHYDLVHFDTIGLAPYRPLAGARPTTLTHHNIESHMMLRRAENARNPLARAYFRCEGSRLQAFERRVAGDYSAHITCSELDSERLASLIPGVRTVVVPNGVDCEYFTPAGGPQRPASLIFVGTMNWYPNVDAMSFFLREIWPGLRERVPAVTLDIVGSNPPASLRDLARGLPGVTIHGYVPDVRPLIDCAAIFVCPIRDGGGTKLKLLDAFAMRKCVVAHPIACEGIDATPDEHVALASTPADFIDRIVTLLAAPERREAMGRAARELVEQRYSFATIGAQFSDMMEAIARGEAHAA